MSANYTPVSSSEIQKKVNHEKQATVLFSAISIMTLSVCGFVLYTIALKYHAF